MELAGQWKAHEADDELRRVFHEIDFRDRSWFDIPVPGHWATSDGFASSNGPILYRRLFEHPMPLPGTRHWLDLDGVFYQGDVWLDSTYLGDTDGYFFPHRFEVTAELAARRAHVLAVEVSSPPVTDADAKRTIVGAFGQGDHFHPDWNPGGIWRPVRITASGPVAIIHSRLKCTEATDERATIALRMVLDSEVARPVRLRTRVCGIEDVQTRSLAAGENRVEWTVNIAQPVRWWPHALGPSPLHDVVVDVIADDGDVVSDHRLWRTGLRSIELRRWVWHVNGERLFVKGANLSPTRPDLGNASTAELVGDVALAREAGLDLIRLHTHITRPELYVAANELGMLVWQDLPLHRRYARTVRKQALRQTREAVDLLGHHPCVALWCVHNEPYEVDEKLSTSAARQGFGRRAIAKVLPQQLPSWNRTVLDGSVKVVLERNDGTRPVVAHSGVAAHLPQLDGTDSHLWFGWYEGEVEDLAEHAATVPRSVRFVSEFGAQAPPPTADFCRPETWPDLNWAQLVHDYGCQTAVFDERCSPDEFATFEEWRDAAQRYQAGVVGRSVEILRRLKYHPTGGFCVYKLRDPRPAVSFSVVDHAGRPKLAFAALRDACRPVIAVADALPPAVDPGTVLELPIHVVSDVRHDLVAARVRACARWRTGSREWVWGGDIPADACIRIAELTLPIPPSPGPLRVEITVQHPSLAETTTIYETTIRPASL